MYLTKKKVRGYLYYYAVISKRVNGKPRVVWQKYLGKLEDIIERAERKTILPQEATIFEFGAIAALWAIAKRLSVVEIIDLLAPKRRQGGTVGEYLLIAAINRATAPKSKAQIGDWFDGTVLRQFLPHLSSPQLSSQQFWNHMDRVQAPQIRAIERHLTEQMVREFDLDLRAVVYDTTNFLTYIDSGTPCTLPQRGNSKEKRFDLRIVGLALLVTTDFHIPLFHDVYPGNEHDTSEFASVVDELVERYRALSQHCEHVTIVWDKGNNDTESMERVNASPYHVVGSLVPAQHGELLQVPKEQFRPLKGDLAGHETYRTRKHVLGAERTVVVVYNESLYLGQIQGLATKLKKASSALRKLNQQLERRRQGLVRGGKAPTVQTVQKQVDQILAGEYLSEIISAKVQARDGVPEVHFHTDHDALHHLTGERYGKTILFTSNHDWTDEEIIRAYRGQASVEDAFAQMKDPHWVAWRPMYHWTDAKIRVHAFYCVLALTLVSLLHREVHRLAEAQGVHLDPTSAAAILEQLAGIKQVAHIYPIGTGIKPALTFSTMTRMQERLFDLLELEKLGPSQVLQEESPETAL